MGACAPTVFCPLKAIDRMVNRRGIAISARGLML
jgi:hypothetical protein